MKDITFDKIEYGIYNGFENMAIDEALLQSVIDSSRQAFFRLYSWKPSAITMGYTQKIKTIDLNKCQQDSVNVVRRMTGGRAVLHDNEITYCIALKKDNFTLNQRKHYFNKLSEIIISGLSELNVEAQIIGKSLGERNNPNCFNTTSMFEIVTPEKKKLVGSSLLIKGDTIFQQGSIPIDQSHQNIVKYLNVNNIDDKSIKLSSSINEQTGKDYDRDEIVNIFMEGVKKAIKTVDDSMTDNERIRSSHLIQSKYKTDDWNSRI